MKRSLLIVCLFASTLFAQEARKGELASLVPANTLLLIEFDDLGGFERWSKVVVSADRLAWTRSRLYI